MDTKVLEELGLTKNEITIYLSLIQSGESSANTISEKTGLHRGYIYDTLSRLVNKGLVSYYVKSKKKYFKGVHPSKILNMIKEKEEKIKKLIPSLIQIYKKEKQDYKVEILEGKEGIKTFYDEIFDNYLLNSGEEIFQLGLKISIEEHLLKYKQSSLQKKAEKFGIIKKIRQGKINHKILFDKSAKNEKRISKQYAKFKYLPSDFDTKNNNFIVVGNKIVIESYEDKPFVIVITSKNLSKFFKNMFNMLWKASKK